MEVMTLISSSLNKMRRGDITTSVTCVMCNLQIRSCFQTKSLDHVDVMNHFCSSISKSSKWKRLIFPPETWTENYRSSWKNGNLPMGKRDFKFGISSFFAKDFVYMANISSENSKQLWDIKICQNIFFLNLYFNTACLVCNIVCLHFYNLDYKKL